MLIDIPVEIIKLEDDSYHIMIEARFENNIKGDLIIDTGASKTVLDVTFASNFAYDIDEINEQNSSGINAMITETKMATIPLIKMASFELRNYKCLLLNLSHINELYKQYTDKQIAGLMGSDFLINHEAVIDYGQKRLSLNYTA